MALPLLATVANLSDWLGEPIADDTPDGKRAGMALAMASALVRDETLRDWVTEDGLLVDSLPEAVRLVTLACAARGYTNPRGLTDASEALDDYNRREQVRVEEAGLYLTASERGMLARYAGRPHRGISVLHTTRDDIAGEDPSWVINGPSPVPGETY